MVINAVGILRESGANTFERVHIASPKALFEACQRLGVQRVIQISALGSPEAGEYLVSKPRGDVELAHLELDWTILRPSSVYSISGSYGGTSLLRAMAALPGLLFVPGSGDQPFNRFARRIWPLVVVALIKKKAGIREVISAVGPEPVLAAGIPAGDAALVGVAGAEGCASPSVDSAIERMAGRACRQRPVGHDHVAHAGARKCRHAGVRAGSDGDFRVSPLSLRCALDLAPSFVQDRWHARLYFLGPVLRVTLAILWLWSAAVGFLTPLTSSQELFASVGLPPVAAAPLVIGASTVDLVLGILALTAWRPAVVAGLMCASLFVYSVFIGIAFPSQWLEPFGGLTKNLPLIPAVLVMGVLSRRR